MFLEEFKEFFDRGIETPNSLTNQIIIDFIEKSKDNTKRYEELKNKMKKQDTKKLDDLENVIHILEATANCYYNPNNKEWNMLLKFRDKFQKEVVDKEFKKVYGRKK